MFLTMDNINSPHLTHCQHTMACSFFLALSFILLSLCSGLPFFCIPLVYTGTERGWVGSAAIDPQLLKPTYRTPFPEGLPKPWSSDCLQEWRTSMVDTQDCDGGYYKARLLACNLYFPFASYAYSFFASVFLLLFYTVCWCTGNCILLNYWRSRQHYKYIGGHIFSSSVPLEFYFGTGPCFQLLRTFSPLWIHIW
jgi:hypothetical protein